MNFLIIRRFFVFADFRANFCVFFDDYFLAQMGIEDTPSI